MTAGAVVVVVALACATVFGLWWRARDGRLRVVAPAAPQRPGGGSSAEPPVVRPPSSGLASLGSSGGLASSGSSGGSASSGGPAVFGEVGSDVDGAAAGGDGVEVEGGKLTPELLDALGVDRTAGATLLQFSSAFCQPCRAVRRISSEVAAIVPRVRHVEVDAESHLELVRQLRIWRTPTLLILDGDGREVRRATGVPTKAQLIAALGEVLTT
jgi:thiol-disulfide isomerase/thioredoxin